MPNSMFLASAVVATDRQNEENHLIMLVWIRQRQALDCSFHSSCISSRYASDALQTCE